MRDDCFHQPVSFPTTQWTVIDEAGQVNKPVALGKILKLYRPALRSHLIVRFGLADDAAEDILHDFIAEKILEKKLLKSADRNKGKFRNYVLQVLDNYVIQQRRKSLADKREPERALQLDSHLHAIQSSTLPSSSLDAFDIIWAQKTVEETLKRMEAWCRVKDRMDVWHVFDGRVAKPLLCDEVPVGYDQLVEKLNLLSPSQAYNLLNTSKNMFVRFLKSVISEYTGDSSLVDSEINELKNILQQDKIRSEVFK